MRKFPKNHPKNKTKSTDPAEEAKCNVTDAYGVPCKKNDQSMTDPSKDDFMKAVNTIKIIGGKLGGAIPDISGAK